MLHFLPTKPDRSITDEIEFNFLPVASQAARNSTRAELHFGSADAGEPRVKIEATLAELKQALLAVLHRRKKEHLREGYLMTVVHPNFTPEEQVPYMIEHGEKPLIIIQRSTPELRAEMRDVGALFPEVMDAHNAIGSSFARSSDPGLFYSY